MNPALEGTHFKFCLVDLHTAVSMSVHKTHQDHNQLATIPPIAIAYHPTPSAIATATNSDPKLPSRAASCLWLLFFCFFVYAFV
jgi:hypothetical protein